MSIFSNILRRNRHCFSFLSVDARGEIYHEIFSGNILNLTISNHWDEIICSTNQVNAIGNVHLEVLVLVVNFAHKSHDDFIWFIFPIATEIFNQNLLIIFNTIEYNNT